MSEFFLTTTDTERREKWLRLFGTGALPVKSPTPRWRVERGAFGREVSVLGYDLDADRLHWMARERFAGYLTQKSGHLYASRDIDGYLIKSTGRETVHETAESALWQKRPFLFLNPPEPPAASHPALYRF